MKHSLWAFLLILLIGPFRPALAFESLAKDHPSELKCQTACHQPENLKRAKRDKTTQQACAACHGRSSSATADLKEGLPPADILNAMKHPRKRSKAKLFRVAQNSPNPQQAPDQPSPPEGMAYVPAGEFIMGSNERWDDESPEHISDTQAFYIDLYETTNRDYSQFVQATQHAPPYHWPEGKPPQGKEKHPVIYVNWFDARDYCQWKGKRLPTEKEWEKAARGEEGLIYPWGNVWDVNKSNNPYKETTGTQDVGSYPQGKSPYGLFDMSGNVWEWVDSYYLPHPGNEIPSPEYGKDKRVLKGGSWFDCLSYGCGISSPTFNRSFFTPEVRNNSFGFRCAKTP